MPVLIRAAAHRPEVAARKALWLASSATDGRTGLEVRVGSSLAFMFGFLTQGLRQFLHLPVRPVEMRVKVIDSGFTPLDR
jgi:hypothetical protein